MLDDKQIVLGQLVTSIAGRDHGTGYLVVAIDSSSYIYVANGRNHPIAKPKKKNIRHVKVLQSVATVLTKKLAEGETVTDEAVRQAIACFCEPDIL
ncbi:KOW domain-containing RNA-binding protein [Propionispora vibrioides]|uniref:Ribosomal protein L14E/L6E/L27E n=1 Tax=Propionispora vibrioides TaxID=112903 RepID=A0A1H8WFD1_9FIRM|nr:KOW domain-containing RNA-binding protein [Propionispora vibrioides]SEP26147.1 hypothetical protein SAMN04490178_11594 [Propionispora vibrioides]